MAFDAAQSAAAWSSALCGGALTWLSRLAKTIRAVFVAGAVDESRPAGAGRLMLTCSASYTLSGLKAARPEYTSGRIGRGLCPRRMMPIRVWKVVRLVWHVARRVGRAARIGAGGSRSLCCPPGLSGRRSWPAPRSAAAAPSCSPEGSSGSRASG